MIKNIVFDMGKVLVDYDARRVLEFYGGTREDIEEVYTKLFSSSIWIHEDLGILSDEEILEKVLPCLRSESAKKLCKEALCNWHRHNLMRKPDMEKLCERLKGEGFELYVLSNAAAVCRQALKDNFSAYGLFSGMLFSAEAHLMKPQREFYERFFEKFSLKPEECIFVDDLKENIRAGEALGMRGYVFDGDSGKLFEFLMSERIRAC